MTNDASVGGVERIAMTIWKYELPLGPESEFVIGIPEGAKVLCVQPQAVEICMWVQVCPEHENENRTFVVHGTGHPIESVGKTYIGTVQIGPLVWHVFEKERACTLPRAKDLISV